MAKDKSKQKSGVKRLKTPHAGASSGKSKAGKAKPTKASTSVASGGAAPANAGGSRARVNKAVETAKIKAKEIATNPAVAEIVAASLVAAAAAIKNPSKARSMAESIGDELEKASRQNVDKGNAFWALALDVARRSIDALGSDRGEKKSDRKPKAKGGKGDAKPRKKAVKSGK